MAMDCVKMEAAALGSKNIAQAINPAVPARGMEQAFCCLYFLTKQRICISVGATTITNRVCELPMRLGLT